MNKDIPFDQLIDYAAERQKEIGVVPSIELRKELQELEPNLSSTDCIHILSRARAKNRKD